MLERRRRHIAGEIVGVAQCEPIVSGVQRAGDPVAQYPAGLQRWQQHGGGNRGGGEDKTCRGEQPSGPRTVEPGQSDSAGGRRFAIEDSDDQ